jgi:hypothetical protein
MNTPSPRRESYNDNARRSHSHRDTYGRVRVSWSCLYYMVKLSNCL